jgi:NAD(P)-dependent dehydrogenase (short-subunit alcohol dehydrogenase family)
MKNLQLDNKSVLITGANTGIGKAVALLFAKEGANISFIHFGDEENANKTKDEIVALGKKSISFDGDVSNNQFIQDVVSKTVDEFGTIDILVNNAGTQVPCDNIENIKEKDIRQTFDSNIIGMILLTKAVFPFLKQGSAIINTTSATAYLGHEALLDYSATKGAIVSFTRSLALQSKPKGIRVNAVAPGPVATPLTEETFGEEEDDGSKPPFERNASTEEIAASFLFLASDSSSQMTGQVLHPNGGLIVNG